MRQIYTKKLVMLLSLLGLGSVWSQTVLNVESVVGQAFIKNPQQDNWRDLRVGNKVREKHSLRTGFETSVGLRFPDASLITLGENTTVDFTTLVQNSEVSHTKVNVKNGSVAFNIKKLTANKSAFEFESSTATAAIRGTEGSIFARGQRSMAFLRTGLLELSNRTGQTATIAQNQLALQTEQGFQLLELPSNLEDLNNLISGYLSDSTALPSAADLDSLVARLVPNANLVLRCAIDEVPPRLEATRMRLTGTANPQAVITVQNLSTTTSPQGRWALDLAWPLEPVEEKVFAVAASLGEQKASCGEARFQYVRQITPLKLNLTTPKHLRVCQPVQIAGSYQGDGAQLVLKVGERRVNLSSATGEFNYSLILNDQSRNWNLKQVSLELSNSENSISEVINLEVDHKCKGVNTIAPELQINLNESQCSGMLSLSQSAEDYTEIAAQAGNLELFTYNATNNVRGMRFDLKPGTWDYQFTAQDQAGNRTSKKFKKVSCFPDVNFNVNIGGPSREVLRIPPPPPSLGKNTIKRTVQARILNIPDNDPSQIKTVTIKFNGRVVRQYKEQQIRELVFYIDVELDRQISNKVVFEVEHKSGRVRTATKEFVFK